MSCIARYAGGEEEPPMVIKCGVGIEADRPQLCQLLAWSEHLLACVGRSRVSMISLAAVLK